MKVNFKRMFTIIGLHQQGKSYLAKNVICKNYRTLVIDWHNEYKDLKLVDRYIPNNKQFPECLVELEELFKQHREEIKKYYDVVLVDEASNFFPNNQPLRGQTRWLMDNHSHFDTGFGAIARRSTDMNVNFVSNSYNIIVFKRTGNAQRKYLNNIVSGLGDKARNLSTGEFILVNKDRELIKMNPI